MIMFAAAAGLVFAVAPAGAQSNYQWDAGVGTGSTVQDGGGTWSVGGPNWYRQSPSANDQNWVDGNNALFGGGASGTAGAVTVSGTVAPTSLTLNQPSAGNYTITGGTITLGDGGITANATGTTTVSSTLNRTFDTTINTADADTHLILDGGGSGEFRVDKTGPGTLTMGGTHTWGFVDPGSNQTAWRVTGGTMNIAGDVTTAGRTNGAVQNDAIMNITGTFTSGGHDQSIFGTVNITGDGRWNLEGSGIYELPVNGVLNIQDNAVLDVDRLAGVGDSGAWQIGSLSLGMGWGTSTAVINQSGNSTVNLDFPTEDWQINDGPGLVMGGVVVKSTPLDISTTYNLDGGTLNVSGIFNVNMEDTTLVPPTGPVASGGNGQSAVFNFNGGTLKASQSDSTDAAVISEGLDHLMGNLWHAYVKAGGAIIDTNSFDASIDQALEHDPTLGDTADGGLQKLGAGTLTLLEGSSYTGDTTVGAGVLQVMHANLDDASSVAIGSGAKMHLNFTGTDTIAELSLGGSPQPAGLYNSGTAGAYFTGTGTLQVVGGSTLPGDANHNGFVDDDDLAVLLSNWESDPGTITTWELGDFTADTNVDDDDLAVLLGNWTGSPLGGAAVPEPVSAVLLLIGAPLAALRRRR